MTDNCRKFDAVGLGVSTLDLLMFVDEFPTSKTVLRAHESLTQGGGPVATAMATMSKLGAKTAIIDQFGNDWIGMRIIDDFNKFGVNCDWVNVIKGGTSSIASILVRKRDGERAIVYSPGNVCELDAGKITEDAITSAAFLHLNGRHWEAGLKAAKIAKEIGVKVSFDGGAHRFRPELFELLKMCDICITAKEFAFKAAKTDDVNEAAGFLSSFGPELTVITGGQKGSWVFPRDEESFHQPAFLQNKVIDTTGAGDAYHGAFLFGLANNYSFRKTAELAGAVASLNTQKPGGRTALPTLAEAEALIATSAVNKKNG